VKYIFEELSALAMRKGKCTVCGKSGRRQRTFTMTVNPWNKNPDGTVRTWLEVHEAVAAQARAWEAEGFTHRGCAS
jgi:hypothetical protein